MDPNFVMGLAVAVLLFLSFIVYILWPQATPADRSPASLREPPEQWEPPVMRKQWVPDGETEVVVRLLEKYVPDIPAGNIEIYGIARAPGIQTKIAVGSTNPNIDCVGLCVGDGGERIKAIVDELEGEQIDIIRYSDSPSVYIPGLLQPLEVCDLLLCPRIGRYITVIDDSQRSLAIELGSVHVELVSELAGVEILVLTQEELDEALDRAVTQFMEIEGLTEDLALTIVAQGPFSFNDLCCLSPNDLMEIAHLTKESATSILAEAERRTSA